MEKYKLLVYITGPTAVGKTALSVELAQHFNSVILSADSRQFYRELNIGTAKPTIKERGKIDHLLIDFLSITDDFNVADFESLALSHIKRLFNQYDILFMVGGSGLYLHSIWHGLDNSLPGPDEELRKELDTGYKKNGLEYLINRLGEVDKEALKIVDLKNPVRLIRAIEISTKSDVPYSSAARGAIAERPFDQLILCLTMDREVLYNRINERVDVMMTEGLEQEARNLIAFKNKNALQTVGYQELFRYFEGEYSLEEAVEKIKINTRRFAKRQMTWFRRYNNIEYVESGDKKKIIELIEKRRVKL